MMGKRILRIDLSLLADVLRLPTNVSVRAAHIDELDFRGGTLSLMLESERFSETPAYERLPLVNARYRSDSVPVFEDFEEVE